MADIICDIYQRIGLNGAISVQEGDGISRETQVEYVQGSSFDSGFLSPYFADDRQKVEYGTQSGNGTVYLALVDCTIETERELLGLLEFAKKTMRPLIIVAQDFSSEALTAMVMNKLKLGLKVIGIKAPMLGGTEILEDLQAYSGAKILGDRY